MGSFANSLHIRSDNAPAVAHAIDEMLRAAGYVPTDEDPDQEALWGFSPYRGLKIADARDGWVSILDTDLMGSNSLAEELSRQLDTVALQVAVNDSDSWYYVLYRGGQQVDAFDSSGETDDAELAELEDDDLENLPQGMQDQMLDLEQRIRQLAPPEMQRIQDKMAAGQASLAEIQKFMQWAQGEMRPLIDQLKQFPLAETTSRPHSEEDLRTHAQTLRPLARSGVGEDQLGDVLAKQSAFAEETLREFLSLLGITPFYADLSYRYSTEHTDAQLAAHGIEFHHHLKFEANP